jgi:2-polyprenyl-6-methoxyphenol hydroxylase-like FAD-dependent oxidoreductase
MTKHNVLILGGGVAGLSLAILLAKKGIKTQVLEARERFDGATSGVRISAAGTCVLNRMGIDPVGEETSQLILRYGDITARFSTPKTDDFPAVVVTRLALHEKLMARATSLCVDVVTGFEVVKVDEREGTVEVVSRSGETVIGSLLVGADGVGSLLRRTLCGDAVTQKTYAGYLGVGLIAADERAVEMTLDHYPGHQMGMASCGKVCEAGPERGVFMWTHMWMPEEMARTATRSTVELELSRRASVWRPELAQWLARFRADEHSILVHGPVYNGRVPNKWYSDRTIIIGDAAHPYGPGGQGISMALKDASDLSDVIASGFGEASKASFQRTRLEEARKLGTAAERRNSKAPSSTRLGVIVEGIAMKGAQIFARGKIAF